MIEWKAHLAIFYSGWSVATGLMAASPAPAHIGEVLIVDLGGFPFPLLTGIFAALGVLLSRPLAPRKDPPLGWGKNLLVSLIVLLIALLWVAESRPRPLFAFVVSIGLGFSGFALIELAGTQVAEFIKRIVRGAAAGLGPQGDDKRD